MRKKKEKEKKWVGLLLLKRTTVQFLVPMLDVSQQLTLRYRGSHTLFWPPRGTHIHTASECTYIYIPYTHACSQIENKKCSSYMLTNFKRIILTRYAGSFLWPQHSGGWERTPNTKLKPHSQSQATLSCIMRIYSKTETNTPQYNFTILNKYFQLGVVVHVFTSSTWEAKAGDLWELEVSLVYLAELQGS